MKKVILSAAAIFAFGFASAQDIEGTGGKGFANGDVFISGSVGFSSEKTGDLKSNSFKIMPRVGFFVTDNIAIGGMIGYKSMTDEDGIYEVDTSEFNFGAFARYYCTPASDFSFFGELGFNYMTSTEETTYTEGSEEIKENGFGIALSPGISYFISDNFALEASIGALEYSTTEPDVDGAESTDTFGLKLNLNKVSFGLLYKF